MWGNPHPPTEQPTETIKPVGVCNDINFNNILNRRILNQILVLETIYFRNNIRKWLPNQSVSSTNLDIANLQIFADLNTYEVFVETVIVI